ncbi:hypothetical protein AWM79_15705 [Pseudomonas agarici]|uniref:Uncharacterized protein n=1 Tax=Pseudomonas agarici TaxID=46677 RepID=A0A0X1T3T3_PSEAA|nr:hypothetical protein [Pseudomonas agarici]AMB86671.1 hypothetical protein AWM79_15705 [Pseudomonas agarici]
MSPVAEKPPIKAPSKPKGSARKGKQVGLRSKPQAKSAWDRLPFAGKDHSRHFSSWDVPMTGGYFGGIEVGKIVARMYFKYLRDEESNPLKLGALHLQLLLTSLDAKVPVTEEEKASLSGQRVGFMSEVYRWLEDAVLKRGSYLDAIPERSFVKDANEHPARTDAALMAAIEARGAK